MSVFRISQDTATPIFRRMAGRIQGAGNEARFVMRWGTRIRKMAIETAIGKGGRSFWRKLARSINLVQQGQGATVEATHVAAAQKQFGGPIRAKGKSAGGADALTIPLPGSGAEGKTAARFSLGGKRLFALGMDDGAGVLGYTEGDAFIPLFALVRQTRPQRPDPFFPDNREVAQVGEEEALAFLS